MIEVISAIVGFALTFPVIWAVVQNFMVPAKEVSELLAVLVVSLQDGKLTADEIRKITAEARDVRDAIRNIKTAAKVAKP
jgi:hypothetical protein